MIYLIGIRLFLSGKTALINFIYCNKQKMFKNYDLCFPRNREHICFLLHGGLCRSACYDSSVPKWTLTLYTHYTLVHKHTHLNTHTEQGEDMNCTYCKAENVFFNASFPIFCLNILKFCFSLVDALFELSSCEDWLLLGVNTGKKSISEM